MNENGGLLNVSSEEQFNYLFKHPDDSVQKVYNGFGQYGVLVEKKDTGALQCHHCGQFFTNLGNHIEKCGFTSNEYKEKFGFKRGTPLIAKRLREGLAQKMRKFINNETEYEKKIRIEKMRNGLKKYLNSPERKKMGILAIIKGRSSIQSQNEHRHCKLQCQDIYREYCSKFHKKMSSGDISIIDPGLKSAIHKHFGNWHNFYKSMHFKPIYTRLSKEQIIKKIQYYFSKYGNLNIYNWKKLKLKPSITAIQRKFGLWSNALKEAGIIL